VSAQHAVGIHLPISLSTPIFIGGMISHFTGSEESSGNKGLLFASGLITGEALMGILVALPIFITADKDWWANQGLGWLGIVLFLGILVWLYTQSKNKAEA